MTTPHRSEHILPDSATPLEKALSAADARILTAPHNVIRAAWNPDTCPEHLLPYLAAAWSVDEYDPAWSAAQKRDAIRQSAAIHRVKGTRGAMRRAIALLGMGAVLREWFEYGGGPYRFRLEITLASGAAWTATQARQLWRTAIASKNVRSWLERITVRAPEPAPLVVSMGIISHAAVVLDTYLGELTEINGRSAYAFIGVGSYTRIRVDTVTS